MMHVTDWFPTLMHLIGEPDEVPTDRVLDGMDQSAFIRGDQEDSNRGYFHMFFDKIHLGLRWPNFKVLTHLVENGAAPIQKLATPHIYNLTVNPTRTTPYDFPGAHTWMLYDVYGPLTRELIQSLAEDSVPSGSPADYDPTATDEPTDHPLLARRTRSWSSGRQRPDHHGHRPRGDAPGLGGAVAQRAGRCLGRLGARCALPLTQCRTGRSRCLQRREVPGRPEPVASARRRAA